MGKSSFPEGDMDPLRSHERVSVTTNDVFYGKPAIGFRNKIVDGSHLRTESHVDLGAARGARSYDTSMKSDFKAVSAPYKKAAPGLTTNSSIPLDYYSMYANLENLMITASHEDITLGEYSGETNLIEPLTACI